MKKSNAILIPIHTKKLNWLYSFFSSIDYFLKDLDFDIVLLTSNLEETIQIMRALKIILREYAKYIKIVDVELYIKESLFDEEVLECYLTNKDRCIVNLKKFIGLHWGCKYYNYISVIDCDTIFKNKDDSHLLYSTLIKNYNKNIYFGGKTQNLNIIKTMEECSKFFSEDDLIIIKNFTKDFSVYPWFFDIPCYEKKDLEEFFLFMKNKSQYPFWTSQNWHTFEHIIFIYFRCLYKESRFIDYTSDIGPVIPELLSIKDVLSLKYKYGYMPAWC